MAVGVHAGTALAVLVLFWRDVVYILAGFIRGILRRDGSARMAGCLIVTSIPAALVGLLAEDAVDAALSSPTFVAIGLLFTGGVLWYIESRVSAQGGRRISRDGIGYGQAAAIGLAQAAAIFPGISRSGLTISSALAVGLDRDFAASYSFIASLPVILGGVILFPFKQGNSITTLAGGPILVAAIAAAISGLFAMAFLRRLVRTGKLRYFSYYVWAVGLITLFLQVRGM